MDGAAPGLSDRPCSRKGSGKPEGASLCGAGKDSVPPQPSSAAQNRLPAQPQPITPASPPKSFPAPPLASGGPRTCFLYETEKIPASQTGQHSSAAASSALGQTTPGPVPGEPTALPPIRSQMLQKSQVEPLNHSQPQRQSTTSFPTKQHLLWCLVSTFSPKCITNIVEVTSEVAASSSTAAPVTTTTSPTPSQTLSTPRTGLPTFLFPNTQQPLQKCALK